MERNPIFDTAVEFVNNTSRPIFLTGKAGTGKTTFLRYIRENTRKKCVVVAPTGVAAINANGVTMHSMFQLPFTPFIPISQRFATEGITDKHTLFKNLRITGEKRKIIRDLELVIIDEVSMVRCDTLDAMDVILRYVRGRPNKPFGGVQVLFIGDMFQLPPVMPEGEWSILREYYRSPFFFDAKVIGQCQLVQIELKKIYRQNEQTFIDLLNRVRNGEPSQDDFITLNDRFNLEFSQSKNYVTLTSHNYKADKINQEELAKLPGKTFEFKGAVEGEFPEKVLPTDMALQLKVGAQIMFIRNDKSEERRYYNGRIATVSDISVEGIKVEFKDTRQEITLQKENWENIKYSYNETEGKIDAEVIGAFSQYPIRLAWAITIHKSQGLTFENAIIDAGDSFAAGQVYVALSRCTTLEGIILKSRLTPRAITTDDRILSFSRDESSFDNLTAILEQEKELFFNAQLLETFDVTRMYETLQNHRRHVLDKLTDNKIAIEFANELLTRIAELQGVSEKFSKELERLLREKNIAGIKDRVGRAIRYFSSFLNDKLIVAIDAHAKTVKGKGARKYLKRVKALREEIVAKTRSIRDATYGEITFQDDAEVIAIPAEPKTLSLTKFKKGESVEETLRLLEEGKALDEIARERGLAVSTIETHLAQLVGARKFQLNKVLKQEKIDAIVSSARTLETKSVSALKEALGSEFSFGEIRAVLADIANQE